MILQDAEGHPIARVFGRVLYQRLDLVVDRAGLPTSAPHTAPFAVLAPIP